MSVRLEPPTWLRPYVELYEQANTQPIRAVIAAPPQHGKSTVAQHAMPWLMRAMPGKRHAYVTYAQTISERVSTKSRVIAERDGLGLKFRREYWFDETTGGSVVWTSIGGPLAGEPIDGVLIIDDPTKDRRDAESATKRQHQIDWFDDVADARCHKTASILVMSTRWHPDDLPGQLIKRGWQYVNLKALADGKDDPLGREVDEPLCPQLHSFDRLDAKRRTNAYTWASLYQGEPRPRGGTVFGEPAYYSTLPDKAYRIAYGIDLAYTAKTQADWSVCVELWREDRGNEKPLFYVVGVDRKQVDAPSFTLTLKARQSARRGTMLWYAGGTEKGVGDFISARVDGLRVEPPRGDKFVRAQPVAEAWNASRVLVPNDEPQWLAPFLDEVLNFTGVNDAHDDQVDALAAAYDATEAPSVDLAKWIV